MSSDSTASLSDADLKQIKTRSICREMLGLILDTVCTTNTNHLEPEVCEKAGILQQSLSLDATSKCLPVFFSRYQGAFEDYMGELDLYDNEIAAYGPQDTARDNAQGLHLFLDAYIGRHQLTDEAPGSYATSWDRIRCGDLFESAFNWSASAVAIALTNPASWPHPTEGPIPPLPHVRCLIYTGVIGDDRLLRSEIKAIVKIMRGRLHVKSVRAHLMAPVMLFSITGPWHIRVLEAYFDGSKLVVRNTPLYDLRTNGKAVLQDLCRWWYGNCFGDTKALPHFNNLARKHEITTV